MAGPTTSVYDVLAPSLCMSQLCSAPDIGSLLLASCLERRGSLGREKGVSPLGSLTISHHSLCARDLLPLLRY